LSTPTSRGLSDKFPEIVNIPITAAEVLSSILSLKNKTPCGYDGLSNKIITLCGEQITKPLAYIYNQSLHSGICPDQLKYANIIPCFKKGDAAIGQYPY
jgi:hypothetical protein